MLMQYELRISITIRNPSAASPSFSPALSQSTRSQPSSCELSAPKRPMPPGVSVLPPSPVLPQLLAPKRPMPHMLKSLRKELPPSEENTWKNLEREFARLQVQEREDVLQEKWQQSQDNGKHYPVTPWVAPVLVQWPLQVQPMSPHPDRCKRHATHNMERPKLCPK